MLIFETNNFSVQAEDRPLIDRAEGGHVTITPKIRVADRQQLSPRLAIELMRLTIVTGRAMTDSLKRNGVNIGRINYQDNSNWSVFKPEGPYLHIHLYGRATDAKRQPYGQSLFFPHRDERPHFYSENLSLTEQDCKAISGMIGDLLRENRYSDEAWGI